MKNCALRALLQLQDLSDATIAPVHAISLIVQSLSREFSRRWPKVPLYEIRGPRISTTQEEFEDLSIPGNHPQRSPHKVHYLTKTKLLRSHMTPLVGRAFNILQTMESKKAIFFMPGICYLRTLPSPERVSEPHKLDIWLCQSHEFYESSKTTILDEAKFILHHLFSKKEWQYRASPKLHPYTKMGFSIEISLQSGPWIKILECGEASAELLQKNGLDPNKHRVLAFGVGLERCVMAVKGITDIRLLRQPTLWIQEQMSDLTEYREKNHNPSISTEQRIPLLPNLLLLDLFEQLRWERPTLFVLIFNMSVFKEDNYLKINIDWHSPERTISSLEAENGMLYIANLADKFWGGQWNI